MHAFSTRVDLELLDSHYFKLISKLYESKLRAPLDLPDHQQNVVVPKGLINFDRYMEVLKSSSSYEKLIICLS